MLTITIKGERSYDRNTRTFSYTKDTVLSLEHSLVSVSKWEAKWHKPFLSKDEKTNEEIIDYVRCMTITQNIDPNIYLRLSKDNVDAINKYIDDPSTATWFNKTQSQGGAGPKGSSEKITSELIYYWMVAFEIPFECQKWHLNRLLTLIRICNIKNAPSKKASKQDTLRRNAELNAARKKKFNTKG